MSQENVEVVRRHLPDAGTYRGREAVQRYFAEWMAGWAEVRNEPRELIDAGDQVVVMAHGRFRLIEGARPFEADYAQVWRVRDRLVVDVRVMDPGDALEAAGLSE